MTQTARATGACLCGAVRYELTGTLRKVVYCHCEQCRRTSGHFAAATACPMEHLTITESAGLKWYRSSDTAERGFCERCGASLFWKPDHNKYMGIMAGAIDTPTGLTSGEHIYAADASDYYTIGDDLPQFAGVHEGLWEDKV